MFRSPTLTKWPEARVDLGALGVAAPKSTQVALAEPAQRDECVWLWSCRSVDPAVCWRLDPEVDQAPRPGDAAVVEVASVGNHTAIVTAANERLRLYEGDRIVGVFGNRYATDAFEAEVQTPQDLHLLTNAGMLGTVISQHRGIKQPSRVKFLGFLADGHGNRLNLKSALFRPTRATETIRNVIFVVGTGMNSGKTTTAARLVKALVNRGVRVAACKLTGSVSHRDLFELRATSPALACDFSDYGFPSTYLASQSELSDLFHTMVADAQSVDPEVVIMEIADGVLQRETRMLLRDDEISKHVAGVMLTAPCALSAIEGNRQIRSMGHQTVAVSGIISNSPLFVREFQANCQVPLCCSNGKGEELADRILEHVRASYS